MNIAEDLEFAVLTKRYNETLAVNNINLKIQSIDEIGGDIKLLARPQYN